MTDISGLAADFIEAHRTGARIVPAATALSRSDILAVQSAVSAALGPVAGFKIGAVPGALPIFAPIQRRYCLANGGTREVRDRLGVELEVGFELIRPLPSMTLPARPQDHFRPMIALELVDTRLSDEVRDIPDLKFLDFQINAGLVSGTPLDDWSGADFGTLKAQLSTETDSILDGEATVPGGSALANLDLFLTHVGDHCGGLQVGQIVITGSLCGLPWFTPDALVTGWIEGLGTASVRLTQA